MKTFVAFIRGINVGGHNKLPMAELISVLISNGYPHVKTYIQSGNVLVESDKNSKELETDFQALLHDHFGLQVHVVVRTQSDLKMILDQFPFSEENLSTSYFILLKKEPEEAQIEEAHQIKLPYDHVAIRESTLYLFPEQGYGNSKFNLKRFESKLGTVGTARNYKTMTKLVSLRLN